MGRRSNKILAAGKGAMVLAGLGTAALGLTPAADAALVLRLMSAGQTEIVVDQDGAGGTSADGNTVPGLLSFNGSIGDFIVSITVGSSKPVVGSATAPQLGLVSTDITATGGSLTIELTDTDFGPTASPLTFLNLISSDAITTGLVTYQAFIDNTNAEFGQGQQIGGPLTGSGAFEESGIGVGNPSEPFSLTMMIALEATAGTTSQFDASVRAVAEPATLGVMAVGLAGIGWLARRRRRPLP